MQIPDLVDLETCKSLLKIGTADYDTELSLLITSASHQIVNYLGRLTIEITQDSDQEITEIVFDISGSPTVIPEEVQLAVTMLVGTWYKSGMDGNTQGDFKQGFLPDPIQSLLYQLRDPVIA